MLGNVLSAEARLASSLPVDAMLVLERSHQVRSVELIDSNCQRSGTGFRGSWRFEVAGIDLG